MTPRIATYLGLMSALLLVALAWPPSFIIRQSSAATHPPLTTQKGVVAADHPVASRVGASILRKGGNAVDAAVATALTLGVVNPVSSGIGGGGFAVVYIAKDKKLYAFDFRETGPAAIRPQLFKRDGKVDSALSRLGGLAVGVPGEVAGLDLLSQRFGALAYAGRSPARANPWPAA
jgi:gamma-glutamyltranspeptidase